MDKMLDYIKWRGDIPFSICPMNEADCYIISKIGAVDLTGIVGRDTAPITFRSAMEEYLLEYGEAGSNIVLLAGEEFIPVLTAASRSERFGDLCLTGFVNIVDPRKTEQFSALTVILPSGMRFITFRGTDDHILAWKENFYLACSDYVHAQRDAVAYLRYHSSTFDGPMIISGHSKGGNLAIYAACNSDEDIQKRIESVYCFDGPGFHREFYESAGYKKMADRIYKIIPSTSMVGTLLDNTGEVIIVKSEDFGIMGHSGFNWETCPSGFVRGQELCRSSRVFDTSIDAVLTDMDMDARRDFIDTMFDLLDSSGAKTVTELTEKGRGTMLSLGLDLIRNNETKQFIISILRELAQDYISETQRDIREDNRLYRRLRDAKRRAQFDDTDDDT